MTQITPSLRVMARLASPPRRRRTLRVTVAGTLLTLSVLACLVTLLLVPAAAVLVLPVVTAVAVLAAALLRRQLVVERAEHGADRLAQARAFTETSVARSTEHAAFAARTGKQREALQREVRELEGTLRLAEARGDEAEYRLRQERAQLFRSEIRIIELEVALERRQSDQIDELAAWPCEDVDTVVDLLNWDQRHEGQERPSRSA